jgi:hypothetical protein
MIFWGNFLSLGNKKRIGKKWEFFFSKVNLIQKCSIFLKKTPNFKNYKIEKNKIKLL